MKHNVNTTSAASKPEHGGLIEFNETMEINLNQIDSYQVPDDPIIEANFYKKILMKSKWTQRKLAKILGKSPATINESLRLLNINHEIQTEVQTLRNVPKSVLLPISKVKDQNLQIKIWNELKQHPHPISVRKTHQIKAKFLESHKSKLVQKVFRFNDGSVTITVCNDKIPWDRIALDLLEETSSSILGI